MHASCDYDIVGLSPGCTSFPLCLSSTFLSLLDVLCFRKGKEMQSNELNLKCVLTAGLRQPSLGFPTRLVTQRIFDAFHEFQ